MANTDGTISLSDLESANFNQGKANKINYQRQFRQSGLTQQQYDSYLDAVSYTHLTLPTKA